LKIERFEDIEAWQVARELTRKIYLATLDGQFTKDYGLKNQIQQACGSIMHNIAEGFDAGSNAEFVKFLRYAKRSCTEVQSQLYVALDQNYLSKKEFDELYEMAEITRAKIGGFVKYLLEFDSKRKGRPTRDPNREH